MAVRPPFLCRCGGLVSNQVCTGCGPRKRRTGWKSDRERGTRQSRGYDNAWLSVRKRKLDRSPLCEVCEQQGVFTEAKEVHHVIAFNGLEDPLRLSVSNLQSLCRQCHNEITVGRSNRSAGF